MHIRNQYCQKFNTLRAQQAQICITRRSERKYYKSTKQLHRRKLSKASPISISLKKPTLFQQYAICCSTANYFPTKPMTAIPYISTQLCTNNSCLSTRNKQSQSMAQSLFPCCMHLSFFISISVTDGLFNSSKEVHIALNRNTRQALPS